MAFSQNGWPGIQAGDPRLVPLSWITGRVLVGPVHTIFDYIGRRFNAEVEPINPAHSWGHYYRAIRGSSRLSNHASATAVDFNAPKHPLGAVGTFTAAQAAQIRAILRDLGGVVRWGGDYSGRRDEMHFEIVGSQAQVASVAARITSGTLVSNPVGGVGGGVTVPNLDPLNPIDPEDDMPLTDTDLDKIAQRVWNYKMNGGDALPDGQEIPAETAGERLRQIRRSTNGLFVAVRSAAERAYKAATRAVEILTEIRGAK